MNKTLVIVMCLAACTPSQPPVVAQTADPEVPEPPVVATPQRAEAPPVVDDEPAHLAGIFRRTPLTELGARGHTIERKVGQVEHELKFFDIAGLPKPLADQIDAEVRKLGQIDEWKARAKGRGGHVWVTCSLGLAVSELVSFGCDIMDSTLTLQEIARATGGAPGAATGDGRTFAISDGKLTPVALGDLLISNADLTALAKRAATEDEFPDESWSADRCSVGESSAGYLEVDGLRVWDVDDSCASLLIPYEVLAPALRPGGVIARYVAIISTVP